MADLHSILGISKEAGETEIKKAFRKIALECHPDRVSTSSAEHKDRAALRFKAATEAYEALIEGNRLGLQSPNRAWQQKRYQQYYSQTSNQYNPYGHAYRASQQYKTATQRSGLPQFLRALTRNTSRTDAMFHVGLASLLAFGVILGGSSGEYLWSKWNRGLLYEDVQRNLARQPKKEQRSPPNSPRMAEGPSAAAPKPATSAQRAANVAASAGRAPDRPSQLQSMPSKDVAVQYGVQEPILVSLERTEAVGVADMASSKTPSENGTGKALPKATEANNRSEDRRATTLPLSKGTDPDLVQPKIEIGKNPPERAPD